METTRKKITFDMDPLTMIVAMAEGNPGAVRVLTELIKADPMGIIEMLNFDDMNMRGSQIWVAYKDYCGCDIHKLRDAIKARDAEMIEMVNDRCFPLVARAGGAAPGYEIPEDEHIDNHYTGRG